MDPFTIVGRRETFDPRKATIEVVGVADDCVVLRIDDESNPAFWCTLRISAGQLESMLMAVHAEQIPY